MIPIRVHAKRLLLLGMFLIATRASAADVLLRVMTFNLRYATAADGENSWPNRKDVLLEAIRTFDPDLLGTQETLALQADFLVEKLPGSTLVGVGRDDGKRQGEFSALLFKKARFDLIDSGTFWLSETPEKIGSKSWDSSLPRIATWVRLRDKSDGGREICYLNTHWDHRGNQARVESAKIIRRWISEHAPDSLAIVTGDLNITEDHEGYRTLASTSDAPRLRDVFRLLHPQQGPEEATFHNFSGKRGGRRIDFIFASPEATPLEVGIDYTNRDGHYPSDHYPVTAVLRVDKPATQ
jgi:endonuclease/exonuclease/phosphatase family metal-dependent hydrolase